MCISLCLLCTILEWHIHDFVVLIPMMVLLYICFWFRKLLTNTAPIIFSRSGEREGRISRLRALQPAPPDASTMPVAEPLHAQRNQYSFFFFFRKRGMSLTFPLLEMKQLGAEQRQKIAQTSILS